MKSENDDKEIVAQHIYTYYHNKRKKAIMRNEKMAVTSQELKNGFPRLVARNLLQY